jgi:hypothetical protein
MRMTVSLVLMLLFCLAGPLSADRPTPSAEDISFNNTFLLRYISGTGFNPGTTPHQPHLFTRGAWRGFTEGVAFVTYVTQSGPKKQQTAVFSTNWLAAAAQRPVGTRGLLLFRGRLSAEPGTVPSEGYPMLLQYVRGERLDHQPAHDAIGEAAADLGFRVAGTTFVHAYLAPVGDPALGAVPFAQRSSAMEFAEAPYAYDIQEQLHRATNVATIGVGSRFLSIEGSAFHSVPPGTSQTKLDFGSSNSWSGRITLTPSINWSAQFSSGRLRGTMEEESRVDSASLSYNQSSMPTGLAVSLIWARERDGVTALATTASTAEMTWRFYGNYAMLRFDMVDRPAALFSNLPGTGLRRMNSGILGYSRDILPRPGWRMALGANIDYHSAIHDLGFRYGHKPQDVYVFLRVRTEAK